MNGDNRPNILLLGIDSLRAANMSCYGYHRRTTPHIDRLADQGVLFENTFCPHIPTTSAYASMLTGLDCFNTQVVALRHEGPMRQEARTLAEYLRDFGYQSTCVGFENNPSSRGFDTYLSYEGWGNWSDRPLTKAENLNEVTIPELERLAAAPEPFFLFLRHMDPHSPYLPPSPFDRMFYHGDECAADNRSMEPVMSFKPFWDYFASWMPPGISDHRYIDAQYDGAIAYMDCCIQVLLTALDALNLSENTMVILNGDHGEILYEHECWYDHHGMYEGSLHVPLIMRYPGKLPSGKRISGFNQHKDLVPTILELVQLEGYGPFDGASLLPMIRGEVASHESEFYITECTWMRKHGWRTPQWKLIQALEPDFHFKPLLELYNLVVDPLEQRNLAADHPDVTNLLLNRMEAWIAKREIVTGLGNPMLSQFDWHGHEGIGFFESSQQAYDTLHIGDPDQAAKLQDDESMGIEKGDKTEASSPE